jgi:hypothetical protein
MEAEEEMCISLHMEQETYEVCHRRWLQTMAHTERVGPYTGGKEKMWYYKFL